MLFKKKMNFLLLTDNESHLNEKRENEDSFDINENSSYNMAERENSNDNSDSQANKDNNNLPIVKKEKITYLTQKRTKIGKYNNNNFNFPNENMGNMFNNNISYFENCENVSFNEIINKIKKDEYIFHKPCKRNYLDLIFRVMKAKMSLVVRLV